MEGQSKVKFRFADIEKESLCFSKEVFIPLWGCSMTLVEISVAQFEELLAAGLVRDSSMGFELALRMIELSLRDGAGEAPTREFLLKQPLRVITWLSNKISPFVFGCEPENIRLQSLVPPKGSLVQ